MFRRNPSQNSNPHIIYSFTILNNKHITIETKLRKKTHKDNVFGNIQDYIDPIYIRALLYFNINSYMVGLKDDFKINLVYNYLEEVKIRGVLCSYLLGGAVRG